MHLQRTSGRGLWINEFKRVPMFVRAGAAIRGQLMMQDHVKADAATTTSGATSIAAADNSTSTWRNMITPATTGIDVGGTAVTGVAGGGPAFGVLESQAVADDTEGLFTFDGFCTALVIAAAGSVAVGNLLTPTNASRNFNGSTTQIAFARGIARAEVAMTTPTSATLGEVCLNGLGWLCMGFAHA